MPDRDDGRAATGAAPALEVAGVSVQFGGVAALSNVSLRAEPGVVTGLIGPNGAGKTTLFNVITGLQHPDKGTVHLDGADITRMGTHRRARLGLARTFQRLELFSTLSAADNVRVGLEASGRATASTAVALLGRVGVGDEAASPVSSLPTGSARLVEPGARLDERETQALGRLLTSLAAEGRAIVLVEHDTNLVLRVCGMVHVLDFGEVIASGTPDEVRRNPIVQEAYLGHADDRGDGA